MKLLSYAVVVFGCFLTYSLNATERIELIPAAALSEEFYQANNLLASTQQPNTMLWMLQTSHSFQKLTPELRNPVTGEQIPINRVPINAKRNCYGIVLNQTESMRARWGHAKATALQAISLMAANDYVATYHFSDAWHTSFNATLVSQLGAIEREKINALHISGQEPQLYQALLRTMDDLQTCPGVRKHLLVFTAGASRDHSRTLQEVMLQAKQRQVTLHTLAFNAFTDAAGLDILQSMAEETQGLYHIYFNAEQAEQALRDKLAIHSALEMLTPEDLTSFAYGQQEAELWLHITRQDGSTFSLSTPYAVAGTTGFDNLLTSIRLQTGGHNPWLILALFALLIGVLVGGVWYWYRRQQRQKQHRQLSKELAEQQNIAEIKQQAAQQYQALQQEVQQVAEKVAAFNPKAFVSSKQQPYGWLIDLHGQVYDLTTYSTTIGRHTDNDVVLNDDHVSGQHAILDFKNGIFVWTDRAPLNPTTINNERVVGSKQIWPNDAIQIGATQLRFVLEQV